MDTPRQSTQDSRLVRPMPPTLLPSRSTDSNRNPVTASQARAARRREARLNEKAVAAWLRELTARGR